MAISDAILDTGHAKTNFCDKPLGITFICSWLLIMWMCKISKKKKKKLKRSSQTQHMETQVTYTFELKLTSISTDNPLLDTWQPRYILYTIHILCIFCTVTWVFLDEMLRLSHRPGFVKHKGKIVSHIWSRRSIHWFILVHIVVSLRLLDLLPDDTNIDLWILR